VVVHDAGGWQAPWVVSALLVLLVGLPLIVWLLRVERIPNAAGAPAKLPAKPDARDWSRAEVVTDPILYLLLAGTLAPPFIGTVIFFHQSYLIDLRGYDPLVFAAAFPVMAVTTIVFGFVCGYLVDRFGAVRLLPYFLLPLAGASLSLAWVEASWAIYLFMLLLGISNGFTQTLFGTLWPEVYGTANLGGIRAITVSAMVFATAAGPGLTGLLIDQGMSLPQQMLWMGVWCLASCALLAWTSRAIATRKG
jgi:MFS family permease